MNHDEIVAAIERLEKLGSKLVLDSYDIVDAVNDSTDMFEVRNIIIDLLRQADTDTHMILPVDADGEPIHIGDELISNHSKKKFIVTRLQYSRKHAWMIGGADKDDLSEYGLYAPCETRHYQPTVEELLFEFGKICQDGYDIGNSIHEYVEKIRELMGSDQ